jgi:uncharacterized protein with FMN-binding domain
MKRAPIVLASTVAGLGLVVAYNPHSATTIASSAAAGTGTTPTASTPATTASGSASSATTAAGSASPATSTAGAAQATTAASGGTATGTLEQISEGGRPYGEIQVKATVKAGKVTAVSIVQLSPSDGRSSSIDDFAVPQLVQETLAAGTAKIDSVSGATYTSQAYAASLQAALDKLV